MSTKLDFSKLTLMDALDLAALIEIEAFKRYTQFVEQLGTRNIDDAGAVFESMAINLYLAKKHDKGLWLKSPGAEAQALAGFQRVEQLGGLGRAAGSLAATGRA